MNFFALSGLLIGLSCAAMAVFVFSRNRFNHVNQLWSIFCICVAIWGLGCLSIGFSQDSGRSLVLWKVAYVSVIIIPSLFYHFVLVFLGMRRHISLIFSYAVSIVFLVFDATPLMMPSVTWMFGEFYYLAPPGIIYPFFVLFFVLMVFISHLDLWRFMKVSSGDRRRMQVKWFFMASFVGYSGAITCFLPVFGIEVYPFGNFTVPLYPVIMAYAIVAHQLFDIEVIIRKTLVFAGIVAAAVCAIALPLALVQAVIGKAVGIPPFWMMTIGIATAVLIYRPIDRRLTALTDRFLFQQKVNYRELLKEASQQLAAIKSLKLLARLIVAFLIKKARIASAAVFVLEEQKIGDSPQTRGQSPIFRLIAARPRVNRTGGRSKVEDGSLDSRFPPKRRTDPPSCWAEKISGMTESARHSGMTANEKDKECFIDTHHPLIQYFKRFKRPLERTEIESLIKENAPEGALDSRLKHSGMTEVTVGALEEILAFLREFKAEAAVPSFLQRASGEAGEALVLKSILFLGPQKSDEPYRSEDLDVFLTLAQESAIAVENARLFDEAVTALKEAEEANQKLQTAQASLIAAEKKATLVGMAQAIGHEIYNPLSPIIVRSQSIYRDLVPVYSGLLNKYGASLSEDDRHAFEKTNAKAEQYGKSSYTSAIRIEGVVRTLTGTLKESTGEMGPLSLLVLWQRTLEASRFTMGEERRAGCGLKVQIAANVMIHGNPDQLEQVFLNLLKNSYDAMAGQKERRIEIRGSLDPKDPKMARIEFEDNGPGIPPELLPKIWQHGFSTKEKKSESLGASGQGMGLFVSKHIIESIHKGTITVTSAVGKSTTFILHLPLTEV